MKLLLRALLLGHLRGGALRAGVTVVAVALGVAIALAIDLANATAVASFARSVNVVASHVNLQVLGVGRGFDERVFPRIAQLPGVENVQPAIEGAIVVGARRGDAFSGEILHISGVDVLRPLPQAAAFSGALPGTTGVNAPDPNLLVNGGGAIVSDRVARTYHLERGGLLRGLAGDRPVALRVAAILPPSLAGIDSSVVFVDIATAQETLGKAGLLDRIDLVIPPAKLAVVTAQVRALLPHGVRAIEPAVRTGEIQRMLRSFQLNLSALSAIALLVGMYLIYNTVAISVVQRRPEIGTLRALGATRGAIFRAFVAEGLLFGVTGSLLGLALGAVLAQFSVAAVTRTVDALYVATHADRVFYDPLVLLKAFVVGIVLATLSAVVPALEAAGVAPALTMRAAGFERRVPHFATRLALFGVLALVLAYACTFAPPIAEIPVFGYASGLLIILGISLATPLVIDGVGALAHRLPPGPAGTTLLATANLASALRRTSVAVASLAVAIGMMVSVAILIGSFRTTVVAWADDTIKADLFVRPLGLQDASYDARFSPQVVRTIAALPGVDAVDTFRAISLPYHGRLTTLAATDFASLAARNKLRLLGGADAKTLAHVLPGTTNALVSEPFATRFGTRVGDAIPLDTPSGNVTLHVAGIYNDYSSDSGVIMIDQGTFARLFRDDSVNSIAIYAKPGADLPALRTRVLRSVEPLQIDVETTRELRGLVIQLFNRTFAITYALYVISITIALLGVVSTLFALVLERRREIGLLRYLGMRAADVRRMVLVEAAWIGVLGGGAGLILGTLLALLLIFVINRQAFGWLIELHIPYDFLAGSFAIVVIAALIAGLFPARVAARIRTAEVVRTE